jgi:hypothetical protein
MVTVWPLAPSEQSFCVVKVTSSPDDEDALTSNGASSVRLVRKRGKGDRRRSLVDRERPGDVVGSEVVAVAGPETP